MEAMAMSAAKIDELFTSIRRIMRAFDLHSRTLLKDHGLTGPQLMILTAIAKSDGITVTEIARRVSLSQATVTNVLTRLERQQLVSRTRDAADKRKIHVQATERTTEILGGSPSLLQWEFYNRFFGIPEWEQSLLVYAVQRLADMMDPQSDAPSSPRGVRSGGS